MQRETEQARLAEFIRTHVDPIVSEWVAFTQTRRPASDTMTHLALKDRITQILEFIADDLETPQTAHETSEKSKARGPEPLALSAARIHATLRLEDGFDIDQMVSEYRVLRASVVKQWSARKGVLAASDLEDLTRFNEAVD